MSEYDISRATGRCAGCNRPLEVGEAFYSVLLENKEAYLRQDIGLECWQGPPPGAVCHYRTRVPKREEKRKVLVDDTVLVDFFRKLAVSEEAGRERFRFVLSLILLRKRLLKYDQTSREGGREFWHLRLMADKSVHRVANPRLDESQIEGLMVELGSILEGYAAEAVHAAEEPGADGATQGESTSSDETMESVGESAVK